MSIAMGSIVKSKLYIPGKPFDDPYPCGEWYGMQAVTGDASAGYISVVFSSVNPTEAAKHGWSIECVSVRVDRVIAANIPIFLEVLPGNEQLIAGVPTFTRLVLVNTNRGMSGIDMTNSLVPRLPVLKPERGLGHSYTISIDENTNLCPYLFFCWGWLWHPQAFSNAGGPRKPW